MSDKLVIAKKIYTLEKPGEFFTAMLIRDNKIVELTQKEKFSLETKSDYELLDYSDFTIIPGFNDSHIHVMGYSNFLKNINLIGCNKQEFIIRIKDKANSLANDEWIVGRGWDHENFVDGTLPTKEDLDEVSQDHPVVLHRICGHICVVNSKALRIANITNETADPEGGKIDRNLVSGEITGILRENAISLITSSIPEMNDKKKISFLKEGLRALSSKGLTSVQTVDENAYSYYKSLKDANELPLRVYLTSMAKELPDLIKKGIKSNEGDDFLRWGRIKLFSDGSLGAETAALIDNYEKSSDNGMLIYSDEKMNNLISEAHAHGWQLEIHAIGDRSAKQVVEQYEKTKAYTNRAVLTHCQILNKNIIDKMASLGIIANIQPVFLNTDLHWAEKKIGKQRMKYSYAWKTLLQHQILCAGGSDAPVERPDPILGIHAAVNRQDNNGVPTEGWYNNESLTVFEAVELFTSNAAFAEFQEHQKGKFLVNFLADFIILNKDIFEIPKSEIRDIQVIATYVDGKQIFKQNN